jgi:hypothetical protein
MNKVLAKEITISRIFVTEQHESTEKYGEDDDIEDGGSGGCDDAMSQRKEPKQTTSSIHKRTQPSITKIDLPSHDPPDGNKEVYLRGEHYSLISVCHSIF